jgi:hypothetical protein
MLPNLSVRDPNAPPKLKGKDKWLCMFGPMTNEMMGGEGGPTDSSDTAPGRSGAAQIPLNYYSKGGKPRTIGLVSEDGDAKGGAAVEAWNDGWAALACLAN